MVSVVAAEHVVQACFTYISTLCLQQQQKATVSQAHHLCGAAAATSCRKSSPGQVRAAVLAAVRCGYRHIDCAAAYGNEHEVNTAAAASSAKQQHHSCELFKEMNGVYIDML
jgi:hypothetical protein